MGDYCVCCGAYIGESGKQYCKKCWDRYMSIKSHTVYNECMEEDPKKHSTK